MRTLPAMAMPFLVLIAPSFTTAAIASEEILALERRDLAQSCSTITFLDGFVTRVEANGDDLPDYLVNMQHLMCDGGQTAFCGTMGCVHHIWLQRADGGFDLAFDEYAYEVAFDRPGDTSFMVATREGTRRENLAGPTTGPAVTSGGSAAAAPSDRWVYRADPAPSAAIGPLDAHLSFTCEAGALRMRYSGWWLFEGEGINPFTVQWSQYEIGIVPTFDIGGFETDIPVRISQEERMLVAKDTLPVSSPLLDALARGNRVTLHHGGSIENELQYPLAGSSAALTALRAACRPAL